jgi:hypothetical protein
MLNEKDYDAPTLFSIFQYYGADITESQRKAIFDCAECMPEDEKDTFFELVLESERKFTDGEKVRVLVHHINRKWNVSPVEIKVIGYVSKYTLNYINEKRQRCQTHQGNLQRIEDEKTWRCRLKKLALPIESFEQRGGCEIINDQPRTCEQIHKQIEGFMSARHYPDGMTCGSCQKVFKHQENKMMAREKRISNDVVKWQCRTIDQCCIKATKGSQELFFMRDGDSVKLNGNHKATLMNNEHKEFMRVVKSIVKLISENEKENEK